LLQSISLFSSAFAELLAQRLLGLSDPARCLRWEHGNSTGVGPLCGNRTPATLPSITIVQQKTTIWTKQLSETLLLVYLVEISFFLK